MKRLGRHERHGGRPGPENRLNGPRLVQVPVRRGCAMDQDHVDLVGSWLEGVNRLSNKGVHAGVTQLEAVKTVFHAYLVIADLLDYLDAPSLPR